MNSGVYEANLGRAVSEGVGRTGWWSRLDVGKSGIRRPDAIRGSQARSIGVSVTWITNRSLRSLDRIDRFCNDGFRR